MDNTNSANNTLPANRIREAMAAVTAGQQNPEAAVPCPVCGAPGLQVEDRSVRPHAEWYALSCTSCGLEDTLHIPLGSRPGSFS